MDDLTRRNPAFLPACFLVAGATLGSWLVWSSPVLIVLLLAAGLALGGRSGVGMAMLALGLWLSVVGGAEELPPGIEVGRPVSVVGEVVGRSSCDGDGRAVFPLRLGSLRQGRRVERVRLEIWLSIEGCDVLPVAGDRWRARGLLRRSSGYRNLVEVAPGSWRLPLVSRRFLELEERAPRPMRWLDDIRRHLVGLARGETGGPTARGPKPRLLAALLLGERATLDPATVQSFRRVGLAHLLAVSGLHVAVLAGLVWLAARPLPRLPKLLLVAGVVTIYLLLLGPRPSILRSASMALLALVALAVERPPQGLNALAVAVIAMVVWEPALVEHLGFRLSVLATTGIVVLTPFLASMLPLPEPWRRWLAAPLAAQLATLPLILPLSGAVHPLAPLLDWLAVPWLALYLGLGLPALLLAASGWPVLFVPLAWLDAPALALASLPASPWLFCPLRAPTWGAGLVPAMLFWHALRHPARAADSWHGVARSMAGATNGEKRSGRRLGVSLLAVSTVILVVIQQGAREPTPAPPTAVVFDVGQGDAVLLRDRGRSVLIDGGGWRRGDFGGRVLVPALVAEGVDRLDAVVLTHPDRDHCAGLRDVMRYLVVAEVWMAPGWVEPCARELPPLARRGWRPLWRGDRLAMGRWNFEVLHPAPGARGERNDRSLVLRATVGGRGILLTGDLEAAGERELLRGANASPGALAAVLLKLAHHGSKTSTTGPFLAAVAPRVAVASAGRSNPYGHPADVVLRRLERRGVDVVRTDRDGSIRWIFPVAAPVSTVHDMLRP